MNQYFTQRPTTPPVVKNLMIINGLFFLAAFVYNSRFEVPLQSVLGLHYWFSPDFEPYQMVTHMFMHSGLAHIGMNMFTLWMFGTILEQIWGGKRFLIFYLLTGLGAALLHNGVKVIDIHNAMSHLSSETVELINSEGYGVLNSMRVNPMERPFLEKIYAAVFFPSVGASGAVFGLLTAYGMLFPNNMLYLFFAVPIRAKYLIAGLIVFELLRGIENNPADNIAHFAHLGGVLFAYLIIKYWNKTNRNSLY